MPEEIALADLVRKQEAMTALAATLVGEQDPARVLAISARLQAMAHELEQLALRFEAEQRARSGPAQRGLVEVVLTPAQRERVRAETGVTLDSVFIPDDTGAVARTMPTTDPKLIELYALEEARRRKTAAAAEEEARRQLDESLAAIEREGSPEMRAKLAELKQDPRFLGGLLLRTRGAPR